MKQSAQQQAELRALIAAPDTPPAVARRARMVLLRGQGHTSSDVAALCGVSPPTVDRWVARFGEHGSAGFANRPRGRTQVPEHARRRVLELAAAPPPPSTGLTCWTTRTLADHLRRTDDITVSSNYIATVLREAGIDLKAPTSPPVHRGRRSEPLDVEYEFVVVDGPHARALQRRQTEALLGVLRWLRDHPSEPI
jgi:transposase